MVAAIRDEVLYDVRFRDVRFRVALQQAFNVSGALGTIGLEPVYGGKLRRIIYD
jgi:hypothetical protein